MADVLKRDQNHVTVAGAVTSDAAQDVTMLRVDPATNYLLVSLAGSSSSAGNTGNIAKRDQNHVPVCLAYDETNNQVVEVLTDSNGYLLCDILFT